MAQVNRANVASNLNTGAAWLGGGSGTGGQPGSIDIAAWGTPNITTGPSQALGGAVSWQGILLQSAQTTNIVIGTTSAALTVGTSGIDLSASGANLTIASPVTVTLGANQTWNVASGRTLAMSGATGAISGAAKNVIVSGAGTTTLIGNSLLSWTNSTLTVSGGLVTASDTRSFGAASNTVVVTAGGAVRVSGSAATGPNNYTVSGQGASGLQAAAIYFAAAGLFASGRTLTLSGASPVIAFTGSHAGTIAGSPTSGDVTFSMVGANVSAATFSAAGSFTVPNGNRVVLQGVNPIGSGTQAAADFCLETSDTTSGGLGNASNKVSVKSTLSLTGSGNNSVALARDYFFEGESTEAAPIGTNTYNINPFGSTGTTWTFTGTLTGTANYWVKARSDSTSLNTIQLGSTGAGKLDGSWSLRSFSSSQTIRFHPDLNTSTWTGAIYAFRVAYGKSPTGAATWAGSGTVDNTSGSSLTLAHSSYTLLGNLTFTGSSDMSLGSGNVTHTSTALTVTANTLTIPGNIGGSGGFIKNGAGTLVLSGNNTGISGLTWSAGNLTLNDNGGVAGTTTFTISVTPATLDSTSSVTLAQSGTNQINASFTWRGTANLTLGTGNFAFSADRTITFTNTGENGTLKFQGAIPSIAATVTLDIGGSTASAKQRVTLVGSNGSLADTTAANQHAVTAGYFRIENNNGLGAATTTTTWWVGATNLGAVTTKSALELAGVTTPDTKNVNIYGQGPNDDGALIGASGSSTFSGSIGVPNVAGARIGVKAGATLTLLGSGTYQNINPAIANTPLTFTAEGSGTLNQNRILGANAGAVSIANGPGTVVLSRANLHTGAMTCSAGTTRLTHANAVGAGGGNNVIVMAGATIEVNGVKEFFPATLTLGSSGTPAIFKISA
jgi:autotransporter-associated beta strand protein